MPIGEKATRRQDGPEDKAARFCFAYQGAVGEQTGGFVDRDEIFVTVDDL
jgi:hypothetical protein